MLYEELAKIEFSKQQYIFKLLTGKLLLTAMAVKKDS